MRLPYIILCACSPRRLRCQRLEAAADLLRRARAGRVGGRSTEAGRGRGGAEAAAPSRPAQAAARAETAAPEAKDPKERVAKANDAARVQPTRHGYLNAVQVYPFADGALYQVYAAPGEVTDIALQAGEQLVGSGPVAAGDTVRWVIGDTESGTGASKTHPHPGQADAARSCDQPRDQHRPPHLSAGAALDREDLHGLGVLAVSAGPADRAAAAGRGRRGRRADRQRHSTSASCASAMRSRATIRRGGRRKSSMTAQRSISSSRTASRKARCRPCS